MYEEGISDPLRGGEMTLRKVSRQHVGSDGLLAYRSSQLFPVCSFGILAPVSV